MDIKKGSLTLFPKTKGLPFVLEEVETKKKKKNYSVWHSTSTHNVESWRFTFLDFFS